MVFFRRLVSALINWLITINKDLDSNHSCDPVDSDSDNYSADPAVLVDKDDDFDSDNYNKSSPWDDTLPDPVVDKVFANLSIVDRVRMSHVCKPWKSTLLAAHTTDIISAPWLIMPVEDTTFLSEIRFDSLAENRTYRFQLPQSASRKLSRRDRRDDGYWCCCGSCDGWLLIAVGRVLRKADMLLWNPLSGEIKNLPSLSTLPFFNRLIEQAPEVRAMSSLVRCARVQLSSGNCMVVAIVLSHPHDDSEQQLALCTTLDQVWRPVQLVLGCLYQDICFHKGKLYALCWGDDGISADADIRVMCSNNCEVEVSLHCTAYSVRSVSHVYRCGTYKEYFKSARLVECSVTGELLVVTAIKDVRHCGIIQRRPLRTSIRSQTSRFEIRRWGPLINEDNDEGFCVGEQGVFIGQMGTVSLKCRGGVNENGVRADHIYFATNDSQVWSRTSTFYRMHTERKSSAFELGVYDVQHDEISTKSVIDFPFLSGSIIGWFTPKLS